MSFFLTFGATPTKATDSVSGYISRYTVNTSSKNAWTGAENTKVSDSSVERNGSKVISFNAGKGETKLEASFAVGSMPAIEFDVSTLTLKFLLYIEDLDAIRDRSKNFLGGEIGFYGKKVYTVETETVEGEAPSVSTIEEPVYYTWNLADISLKQGWNRLTLNFKTAKTDNAVNEFTFEGITEFRIAVNKNSAADLTVALDNTEVCVLTIAEDGKVIEPITDTHTTKQLAIAAGITAVVIGGATAACYVMAKKEEKRRRRQRRARALAKKQQENKE